LSQRRSQASTVTTEDCLYRCGAKAENFDSYRFPVTPGFDIVGHIVQVHDQDKIDFEVGDRVAALVHSGGNARYITVPVSSLVRVPLHMNSSQAVTMVSIYSTAYYALKEVIPLQDYSFSFANKKILIILGSIISSENINILNKKCSDRGVIDDVGLALIQMCQRAKASSIYVVAPTSRHSFLRTVLRAIPLNCNRIDDWMDDVKDEMDYVFDGVCDFGLKIAYHAVRKGSNNIHPGQIVCYGCLSMLQQVEPSDGNNKFVHWRNIISRSSVRQAWTKSSNKGEHISIKFVNVWDNFQSDPTTYKSNLQSLFRLLHAKELNPIIAKRISLEDVEREQCKKILGSNALGGGIIVVLPWKSSVF
jgi:NADPH:quinone reductase-like Zn-dependent oxidoreductase